MKFAAPYEMEITCPIDHSNIDEFNIKFTENSSFKELKSFIEKNESHQINIEFAEENYDINKIIEICKDFNNVYVRIHSWEFKYLYDYEENDVNYIFDSTIPVCSYNFLEWVLARKVKGIYITDDLTYNLEEVYKQCEASGIKLRVILNKIPSMNLLTSTCPSVQVYRPQDYDFLSQYYDVGEFYCGEKYSWTQAEVLYRKWFIDHEWNDDLEIMNHDLRLSYPTQSMPPELTRIKANCKHRCTMSSENICSKCKRFLLMGYRNADNNLIYKDPEYGLPSLMEMADNIIISKDNNKD